MVLEIIVGTMFSGKTTELVRRAQEHARSGRNVQCFKPKTDTRYEGLTSHNGARIEVECVATAEDIEQRIKPETQVVVIDEAHFYDSELIEYCTRWSQMRTVIVAGILHDWKDEPMIFHDGKATIQDLAAKADRVDVKEARCTYMNNGKECSMAATKLQRFLENGTLAPESIPLFQVGGSKTYAARCGIHYVKPAKQIHL